MRTLRAYLREKPEHQGPVRKLQKNLDHFLIYACRSNFIRCLQRAQRLRLGLYKLRFASYACYPARCSTDGLLFGLRRGALYLAMGHVSPWPLCEEGLAYIHHCDLQIYTDTTHRQHRDTISYCT